MTVDCFNINIIDTFSNDRSLILEQTQVEAPRLIYNGTEEKYGNLFPSEMQFNILVKSNDEALFRHLFTGSESRYKVQLVDASDQDNHIIKWEGFLLPEQFSEPFKYSGFFVEFVATDGIGLLKSKILSNNFYSKKQSVIAILHQCLRLTSLNQPIVLAPSIQNAGFTIDYIDLCVDTSSYIDGEDRMSVYDILEAVLKSIGCRLFTFEGVWYVIGVSLLQEKTITAYKYAVDEIFTILPAEEVTITREVLIEPFFATPTITMLPPAKVVNSLWDMKLVEYLIPEDVVSHYPVNYATDVEDRTPKYWVNTTDESVLFFVWLLELDENFDYNQLNLSSYYNGLIAFKKDTTKTFGPSVFFNGTVTDITSFNTNYANLEDSFFVYGTEDLERYATVKIAFFSDNALGVTAENLEDAIENGDFNDQFYFAITRRDYRNQPDSEAEVYLSNFPTSLIPDGSFDFDLSVKNNYLHGVLELEKLAITKDGWYNIRLYPLIDHVSLGDYKVYTEVSFTLNLEDERTVLIDRSIDFTTAIDLETFHSDSQMNLSNRRFLFSDELITKIEDGTLLPSEYQVTTRFYNKVESYNGASLNLYIITVGLSDLDYNNLQNGYQLYVKHSGDTELTFIDAAWYSIVDDVSLGGKLIQQLDFVSVDNGEVFIAETDEVYVRLNADDTTTLNYPDHWLDKWRRLAVAESVSFQKALARTFIDINYTNSFVFSGDYALLTSPLDILSIKYDGQKNYIPLMIEMVLDKNRTNITVVESNAIVEDYVDDVVAVDPITQDPLIVIESTAVAPGLFQYNWIIQTNYRIEGLLPVNATITAVQLTDSVGNNGVPTGFEKSAIVNRLDGGQTFTFPIITGVEKGWYKLQMVQGGVQSNLQYVEVDPVIAAPTEYITITQVATADIFNRIGKYTIAFTGFTPVGTVQQSLQKIDAITQSPIGLPVVTTISSPGAEQTITFTQSGTYKVTVLADSKISNEIAWLVFII
tara:strand:+ start:9870 stop:12818 length:2949 start_codon:yes stop_codon:yes gene_type:complete